MAHEPPSLSWHPALMPNNRPPPSPGDADTTNPESSTELVAASVNRDITQDHELLEAFNTEDEQHASDASLPKDDDNEDTNAWIASGDAAPRMDGTLQEAETELQPVRDVSWSSRDEENKDGEAWLALKEAEPQHGIQAQEAETPTQQEDAANDKGDDDGYSCLASREPDPEIGTKEQVAEAPTQLGDADAWFPKDEDDKTGDAWLAPKAEDPEFSAEAQETEAPTQRADANAWFPKEQDDGSSDPSKDAKPGYGAGAQRTEAPAQQGDTDAWFPQEQDGKDSDAWLASKEVEPGYDAEAQETEAPTQRADANAWFPKEQDDGSSDPSKDAKPGYGAEAQRTEAPAQQGDTDAWFPQEQDGKDSDAWLASKEMEPGYDAEAQETEKPTQRDHTDAWFPNEQDDEDSDALLAVKEAGPDCGAEALEMKAPAEAGQPLRHAELSKEPRVPTPTAQHSSSMSFARTVSHEVSFFDDEDAQWNLSRPDTNVFGSVPPLDRTSSFPLVPHMASNPEDVRNSPLPSTQTQALDVMEETEREADTDKRQYLVGGSQGAGPSEQPESAPDKHIASQPIDGGVQRLEAQASEARYEEGISFIPHSGATGNTIGHGTAGAFPDSFVEDNQDGDDFFTQLQEPSSHKDSVDGDVQPVERKSTMQIMDILNPEPRSYQSTLEETAFEPGVTQVLTSKSEHDALGISGKSHTEAKHSEDQNTTEDLATKWQEAFAGEDDGESFLFDDSKTASKEIDAAAFLGSDDEGFLEDDSEVAIPEPRPPPAVPGGHQAPAPSPYVPSNIASQQPPSPYMISPATPMQSYPYQQPAPALAPFNSAPLPSLPRPEASRAESFADKSKGGYASPYDLPTDLVSNTVKPRKRASVQQLPHEQAPPPRSMSMEHPTLTGATSASGQAVQRPVLNQKASTPTLRGQNSFFEDLPVTAKPRSSSRQSNRAQPPTPYAPAGHHPQPNPPVASFVPPPSAASPQSSRAGTFVAPERAGPYPAVQSAPPSVPPSAPQSSGNASRYSPAPSQQPNYQALPPPTASTRYSPTPPGPRPGSSFGLAGPTTPSQTSLPHLPRTSSPLAQFEASSDKIHTAAHTPNGDAHHFDRRSSSSFEPRLNRVSSLPPTREVDEEEEDVASSVNRSFSATQAPPLLNIESRHSPAPPQMGPRHTPPLPSSNYAPPILSPPKRAGSNYMPTRAPVTQPGFVPPPRASTQSPGATRSSRQQRLNEPGVRPSSAHSPAAPALVKTSQSAYALSARTQGQSLSMNMVPPTDGRQHDPLQRWKGTPLIAWGVGGTIATSFPKNIPRYGINQTTPTILRTSGEVKVQNIKDIHPLPERLTKFPGPLKGRSKKKEALAWLAAGIDALEKELPDMSFHSQLSLEEKRGIERLLLWKLLRTFIDFDGALEGNPAVEQAVREVLSRGTLPATSENDALLPAASSAGVRAGPVTPMQADGVDSATMEQIRLDLLKGDRETAVWSAVDKRLWGHAMLISQTVSTDLYKRVAQEFVRKEVNYPGHNNESIAALYKVLSGNVDDCVDELVPIHARAGLQLVSKESTLEPTRDAIDGLDKWLETLTLILSNRSDADVQGLNALGKLLSSYGRAEAAQICFIFSRSLSVFGGLDDPKADFVLLGSDHHQQSDQFAKETEALQLSEVYEYGLSLAGGAAAAAGAPHLAAYKLQHAVTLAEYGYRDKALQYCDAIAAAMVSQTRRSPYHHAILETAVDDFMTRLKQAPKDMSSSWMSKPSMNKVSDSVWNRFNKFVSGDDGENAANGGIGEADNGPFARIAATPSLSRSPSVSNFEVYGGGSPGYTPNPAAPLASATSSRYAPAPAHATGMANSYAPASQYTPASASSARNSSEYTRNSYEPASSTAEFSPLSNSESYAPLTLPHSGPGYQPAQSGYRPTQPKYQPAQSEYLSAQPKPARQEYQPTQPEYQPTQPEYQPARTVYRPAQPKYQPAQPGTTADVPSELAPAWPPAPGVNLPQELREPPNIYAQRESQEADAETSKQGYQLPTYGYEPLQITAAVDDESQAKGQESGASGYEPPSHQPYSYEPPSCLPDPAPSVEDESDAPKPKKRSFMDDDDDIPASRPRGKSKAEKDRENEEMFRKAAEEDAKRAAAQQTGKKGWGFSGWFSGSKKSDGTISGESSPGKPIRAKLGEASSFVYDPELKRWVNKKAGTENTEAKKATPPPPRATQSTSGTPAPPSSPPSPAGGRSSVPLPAAPPRAAPSLARQSSQENIGVGGPAMSRSTSYSGAAAGPPSGPPSRPATSMSNASSIDDLLGAAAPRKGPQKKTRKGGRYVDVIAK